MSQPTTKRRFTNVVDLVRDLVDEEFAHELEEQIAARTVLKSLIAQRVVRNISQEDIAQRLGCTASRVSKLENSRDSDLTLGELAAYASALESEFAIAVNQHGCKVITPDRRG